MPTALKLARIACASLLIGLLVPTAAADDVSDYFQRLRDEAGYGSCVVTGRLSEAATIRCVGTGADGHALGPDSGMQLASVAKHMTAMLALQLSARGSLDLNVKVVDQLPELVGFDSLTLMHLLGNTGGVPNHDRFPLYTAGRDGPVSDMEMLALISAHGPRFEPGSAYEYSNLGWRLAAIALERHMQRPFPELLQAYLFEPLGMADTHATSPTDYRDTPGLEPSGGQAFTPALPAHPDWFEGAATIVTTPSDMAIWLEALFSGEVLARDRLEAALSESEHDYALGLARYDSDEGLVIAHDGRFVGGSADIQFRSGTNFYSAVLSPQNSWITRFVRGDLGRYSRGETMLDPLREYGGGAPSSHNGPIHHLTGHYPFGPEFFVRVRAEGDTLSMAANWGDFTEFVSLGPLHFYSRALNANVVFSATDEGSMAMSWQGSPPVPRDDG
ncbi:serine hydrolase domain-containing protein [Maricaulis sp. CAU 1757]